MKNKHEEDRLNSPSERRHPPKPVSFIKEFASHVSSALGLSDKDPSPPSQTENDANLMATFEIPPLESDRKQIPVYDDDVSPPCKPGPSGTTTNKISTPAPTVDTLRIPEFTREDFWITKDQGYESLYDDDSEWDYIPEDSPLKGKEKARRIERHVGFLGLPPDYFQQYDALSPTFCEFPTVRDYGWGQSDLLGSQDKLYGDPLDDLMRCEGRWITPGRRLSKRHKPGFISGATEVRLESKNNGGDNSRDVVVTIPSLDHFQTY